jgi:phosphopantothenate---cysteine ligase (CTP)
MQPEIQKIDVEFANKIVKAILEQIGGQSRKMRKSWTTVCTDFTEDLTFRGYFEVGMRIVITGGPASEPIDQVRYITNQSTGELAVKLAQRFSAADHQVELFLGRGATSRLETARYFQTNEDLHRLLSEVTERHRVDGVLHAAALSDFGVAQAFAGGRKSNAAKISSDAGSIELRLVPKPKLIRGLRDLFANAYIVGWKFELEGTPVDVEREGVQQIGLSRTNACILNGGAFGPGFGFCTGQGLVRTLPTKDALSDWLVNVVGNASAASKH